MVTASTTVVAASFSYGCSLSPMAAASLTPGILPRPQTPSKFASQMSGDTNAAIMEQFPAELGSGVVGYRGVDMEDDFEAEEISEEEDMLDTRIAEAENMLKMLATEQKVLELRREQQAANAARASDRRRAALADNIDERLPPQTPVEEMKE